MEQDNTSSCSSFTPLRSSSEYNIYIIGDERAEARGRDDEHAEARGRDDERAEARGRDGAGS